MLLSNLQACLIVLKKCTSRKHMVTASKTGNQKPVSFRLRLNQITCTIQLLFLHHLELLRWSLPSMTRYHEIVSQTNSSVPWDSAHLPPFLSKYKWHEVVGNQSPSNISSWVSSPVTQDQSCRPHKSGHWVLPWHHKRYGQWRCLDNSAMIYQCSCTASNNISLTSIP